MDQRVRLRSDDAVDRRVHAAGHFGQVVAAWQKPRSAGAEHKRFAGSQLEVEPITELLFSSAPQVDQGNVRAGGDFRWPAVRVAETGCEVR